VSGNPATVRIYGESYTLRTSEPASRIEEVARLVDARMREVAASGKVAATGKIAVLAALHLADELIRLRAQRNEALSGDAAARIAALVESLDRALAPGGPAREP
jgi:cell division protein ZapA